MLWNAVNGSAIATKQQIMSLDNIFSSKGGRTVEKNVSIELLRKTKQRLNPPRFP